MVALTRARPIRPVEMWIVEVVVHGAPQGFVETFVLAVRINVDPRKVRGVLVGRTPVSYVKERNAIVLDAPRMPYPEGGAPALHTYIETAGVRTRIEHADEQRRYGRYATGNWPKLEAQAALNLEFSAREAIRALGNKTKTNSAAKSLQFSHRVRRWLLAAGDC